MSGRQSFLIEVGDLADRDRVLLFHEDRLVCREDRYLWRPAELLGMLQDEVHFLDLSGVGGAADNRHILAHLPGSRELGPGFESRSLRSILFGAQQADFNLLGRANQLLEWFLSHRYCGRCGGQTGPTGFQFSLRCNNCSQDYFPRINPCSIMLVVDGDHILLARNARYKTGFYSCLAGFIEIGESAEETVAREVKEEVGLDVCNVRYIKSQSWPFPSQLMLGFFADYAGGEIVLQPEEIEEAAWYHIDGLPPTPSAKISVAGELIEHYVNLRRQRG